METIKKPSCIVDFNNEAEIKSALLEAENDTRGFISFETSYENSMKHINSLTTKKPSCIVDFNNKSEIDAALAEAENSNFISFEVFLKRTTEFKNNLFQNV